MAQYIINGAGKFAPVGPAFTHTQTLDFEVQLQNADGTPRNLTGYRAQCALKQNFLHGPGQELIAYALGTITAPETGAIDFSVECRSELFYNAVKNGTATCYFEISLIPSGETDSIRVAFDTVTLQPRVQVDEGEPQQAGPEYPTFAQVNSLLDQREFAPGGGNPGDVLTKTETGQEWKSPEQIVPVTAPSFSPQSGIYYTQTATSGDIDYTFSLTPEQPCTFEFWITKTAAGAWSFSTSTGISCWWEDDGDFAAENSPSDMTSIGKVYALAFRWDGAQLLGNLAYSKAVSA